MPDDLARVLAHPLRQLLLSKYRGEPASPSDVAPHVGAPLNVVSYHTRVLARHGCLELVRVERRRGAAVHLYRTAAPAVIDGERWASAPRGARRALVLGTLRSAEQEARGAALTGGFDGADAHLSRSLLTLDDEGVRAAAEALRRALDDIARIHEASSRRASPPARAYEVVLLGFEPSAPMPPDRVE